MTEYNGPERRKDYEDLDDRIDAHVEHIERRFARWFKSGLLAFTIIGLSSFAALLGFGYVIQEVQQQRRDNVRNTCVEQNLRHDRVVRQFEIEVDRAIRQAPENEAQLQRSKRANLRIIDALAPKQDCEKLVDEAVQP